jgi:hypothetical protein
MSLPMPALSVDLAARGCHDIQVISSSPWLKDSDGSDNHPVCKVMVPDTSWAGGEPCVGRCAFRTPVPSTPPRNEPEKKGSV